MAGKAFTISAKIKAVDKVTRPIRRIVGWLDNVRNRTRRTWLTLRALGDRVGFGRLTKGLGFVYRGVRKVGRAALMAGAALLGMTTGLSLIGLVKGIKDAGAALDKFAKTGRLTGMDPDRLRTFARVAELAGVSTKEFLDSTARFTKRLGELTLDKGPIAEFLKKAAPKLMRQLKGLSKDPAKALDVALKAMARIKDPAKQVAFAVKLFGDDARKMALLVKGGLPALEAMRKKVEELQGKLGKAAYRNAENFQDSLSNISSAVVGVRDALAVKLFPWLTKTINKLADWIAKNRELIATKVTDFLRKFWGILKDIRWGRILKVIGDLASAFAKFVAWISKAGPAVKGFGIALGVVVAIVSPVTAAVLAIAGLAVFLVDNWGKVDKFFSDLWSDVKTSFRGGSKAIQGLFEGDSKKVAAGLAEMSRGVEGLVTKLANLGAAFVKNTTGLDFGPFIDKGVKELFAGGSKMIKALADGIKSAVAWVGRALSSVFDTVVNWAKRIAGRLNPIAGAVRGIRSLLGADDDKPGAKRPGTVTAPKTPAPRGRTTIVPIPPARSDQRKLRPSGDRRSDAARPAATQQARLDGEIRVGIDASKDFETRLVTKVTKNVAGTLGVTTGKQKPGKSL